MQDCAGCICLSDESWGTADEGVALETTDPPTVRNTTKMQTDSGGEQVPAAADDDTVLRTGYAVANVQQLRRGSWNRDDRWRACLDHRRSTWRTFPKPADFLCGTLRMLSPGDGNDHIYHPRMWQSRALHDEWNRGVRNHWVRRYCCENHGKFGSGAASQCARPASHLSQTGRGLAHHRCAVWSFPGSLVQHIRLGSCWRGMAARGDSLRGSGLFLRIILAGGMMLQIHRDNPANIWRLYILMLDRIYSETSGTAHLTRSSLPWAPSCTLLCSTVGHYVVVIHLDSKAEPSDIKNGYVYLCALFLPS